MTEPIKYSWTRPLLLVGLAVAAFGLTYVVAQQSRSVTTAAAPKMRLHRRPAATVITRRQQL